MPHRSDSEIVGASISLSTSGPVLAEKRGIVWNLPRLSPRDRSSHTFQLRLLG